MNTQEIISSPERQALRDNHQLRAITHAEEGYSIFQLPAGIFGFTNSPASEELPAFPRATFRSYELLKLADGTLHFIGYVTASEAAGFAQAAEPVALNLYPEPVGDSNVLIVLPWARIEMRRPPSREGGNWMPVETIPA
jgi:hypothetical protein